MPSIFDNIEQQLLTVFQETLNLSYRAVFYVGYFNIRECEQIDINVKKEIN